VRRVRRLYAWVLALVVVAGASAWGTVWAQGRGEPGGQAYNAFVNAYETALQTIQRSYIRQVPVETLVDAALRGMAEALGDPHSAYLTDSELRTWEENLEGRFGGIGAVVEKWGEYPRVVSPVQGSPAAQAGLLPGDVILEVDGRETKGLSLEAVIGMIRGPVGTSVRLRLRRDTREFETTIARALIVVPKVTSNMLPGQFGYVRVHAFQEGSAQECLEAIGALKDAGMRGLVLDLRGNAGGLLSEVVCLAQALIPKGPVVYIVRREGGGVIIESQGPGLSVPLAVLVDEGTASAAELLAGAVQDRNAGVLVGSQTFGKGSVQGLFPLENGGALKLTIARYLTPNGRSVEGKGIIPDIVVPVRRLRLAEGIPALVWKRDMRMGMVGLDVLALQGYLQALGFEVGKLDGVYGLRTAAGVSAFQSACSLKVTGIADRVTVERIQSAFEAGGVSAADGTDETLQSALEWLTQRSGRSE